MDKRTREAVRYLGFGRQAADAQTLELIGRSFAELEETAQKRIVWKRMEAKVTGEKIMIGPMEIASRSLSRNLKGCEEAVLLGATLGAQTDLLLRRHSRTDMAGAVVLQACAAALLEEYLDGWQDEMTEVLAREGRYPRPRFSPGYGDFSISHQGEILQILDASKRIGLSMTESCMLTPTKSVTALMGLGPARLSCPTSGCEACWKTDCAYRRDAGETVQEEEQRRNDEGAR